QNSCRRPGYSAEPGASTSRWYSSEQVSDIGGFGHRPRHIRIVFLDREDRIVVGGEDVFLVLHDPLEQVALAQALHGVLEVLSRVPPQFHHHIIRRLDDFPGDGVLLRHDVAAYIAAAFRHMVLADLRVLVLVIIDELLTRHAGPTLEKTNLLEHYL